MPTQVTNTIRRLRFDADEMTQADLAARVGVTRQTIMAIEAAKYSPSLELAFLIARAFDKPLNDVFQFDPD
jgi:putative transcriptional regulator